MYDDHCAGLYLAKIRGYCSIVRLVRSVCPSVCGWFAVEKRSVVSVSANSSCQNNERKRVSRSEMILRGNP